MVNPLRKKKIEYFYNNKSLKNLINKSLIDFIKFE